MQFRFGQSCELEHQLICVLVPCVYTMPRRSRPWCSSCRSRPSVAVSLAWSCLLLMTCSETSMAFFQFHSMATKWVSSAPPSARRPLGPLLRPELKRNGFTWVCGSTVDGRRRWRQRSGDMVLRMGTQQETKPAAVSKEHAAALAARSASASAVAKPFVSRKLGSFEKMLTQTRDGVGPAEEGIRTLLTPHVWAAVVDGDLPRSSLKRGVEAVLARHPMLRACIRTPDGPKEPLINILGEEREDGDPLYFCESECESLGALAERVLAPEEAEIAGDDDFTREWQGRLESNLDNARLPVSEGPNWRVETIRLAGRGKEGCTALVCTMNHALEDQRSSNLMLKGILEAAAAPSDREGSASVLPAGQDDDENSLQLPPSMEAAMVEGAQFRRNTLGYMWDQATVAIAQPKVLPDGLPTVEERGEGGDEGPFGVANRRSACEFSSVPAADVTAMLQACRERGQTLSGALSAACLMACSDVAHGTHDSISSGGGANRYKFLLAVDLRRFGTGEYADSDDWTGGTVACAGGAIDYAVKVPTGSGSRLVGRQGGEVEKEAAREEFWRLATRCKAATRDMVKKETLREAVAVFDWAMENMSIWASLDIESRNAKTLGRAYTCGVSNMGRYPFDTKVGDLTLRAVHYGTSQSACGSLFQLSCGTVDGELFLTLQFAEPVVTRSTARAYLQGITDNLRAACGIPS